MQYSCALSAVTVQIEPSGDDGEDGAIDVRAQAELLEHEQAAAVPGKCGLVYPQLLHHLLGKRAPQVPSQGGKPNPLLIEAGQHCQWPTVPQRATEASRISLRRKR
jgi:hypothetical protein